jgi:hypothetical protein
MLYFFFLLSLSSRRPNSFHLTCVMLDLVKMEPEKFSNLCKQHNVLFNFLISQVPYLLPFTSSISSSGNDLTDEIIPDIINFLQSCPTLQSLLMDDSEFTIDGCRQLGHALKSLPALQTLSIGTSQLTAGCVLFIARFGSLPLLFLLTFLISLSRPLSLSLSTCACPLNASQRGF